MRTISTNFLQSLVLTPNTVWGWGTESKENQNATKKMHEEVTKDVVDCFKKAHENNSSQQTTLTKVIEEFTVKRTKEAESKKEIKFLISGANWLKVAGYVNSLFLGRIIGWFRLFATIATALPPEKKISLLVLAGTEILGLNVFRVIIDLGAFILSRSNKTAENNNGLSNGNKEYYWSTSTTQGTNEKGEEIIIETEFEKKGDQTTKNLCRETNLGNDSKTPKTPNNSFVFESN